MQEKHAKWLTGCGIGCAAVVALVVAIGVGAYYAARDVVRDFEKVEKTTSSVDKAYGEAGDYRPDPDGRIPPERIQAFLAVRGRTLKAREEFRQAVDGLRAASSHKEHGVREGFKAVRSALGIPRLVGQLYSDRANALLENEMGFGEYLYIYSLAYYSLLKKDPGDGPEDLNVADGHTFSVDKHDSSEAVRETHRSQAVAQVHHLFTDILGNALEPGREVTPEKAPDADTERPPASRPDSEWRRAVEKELEALNSNWGRIPWQDGLPKQIEESLAPFRAELEASYDPTMNVLEFGQAR